MDDTDRQIIAFRTNIFHIRNELMQLGVQNTEITAIRLEQKLDNLVAGVLITTVADTMILMRVCLRLQLRRHAICRRGSV